MVADTLLVVLACPACAVGRAGDGGGEVALVAALLALPVVVTTVAGLVIGRLLRRAARA